MPEFTIEKNVPRPKRISPKKGQTKYPFSTMDLDDSFPVGASNVAVLNARAAWYRNNPKSPARFSVRKTPDGCRCWRVA